MNRLLAPSLLMLAAGCNSYPYVALLDGDWLGTATDAGGIPLSFVASLDYDEEEEDYPLTGQADMDGYIYNLYSAESDKENASIEWVNPLNIRSLSLSKVTVDEEAEVMEGDFEVNSCYATDPAGAGEGCRIAGTFELERQ